MTERLNEKLDGKDGTISLIDSSSLTKIVQSSLQEALTTVTDWRSRFQGINLIIYGKRIAYSTIGQSKIFIVNKKGNTRQAGMKFNLLS